MSNARIAANINCHPCRLVIATLQEAQLIGINLSVRDIGVYVLNSYDALTGNATPKEIVSCIVSDRQANISRTINSGKNDPWDWEHITSMLNYLYLANLIEFSKARYKRDRVVTLNTREASTIHIFVSGNNKPLEFDVYDNNKYPRNTVKERRKFQLDWDKYNCELSIYAGEFYTLPSCLGITLAPSVTGMKSTRKSMNKVIGQTGESFVMDYEINELKKINPALSSSVVNRADERGIGFDIESIEILGGNIYPKYIEVKTTTRVTPPAAKNYIDTVSLTRNEWKAAQKYQSNFYVYRVYFSKGKVYIYKLKDIVDKYQKSLVDVDSPLYEMRFNIHKAGVVDSAVTI